MIEMAFFDTTLHVSDYKRALLSHTCSAQADKDPTLAVLQTTTYISVLQTTTYISVRTFLVFLKSAPRRRVIQEKKATIERSIPQWRYQPEDYIEFRVALIRITRLEVDFFYKTKKTNDMATLK